MRKIVLNCQYGGFNLTDRAIELYASLSGLRLTKISTRHYIHYEENGKYFNYRNIARDDPNLVKVVEMLGREAGGRLSTLKIIEIPENVEWEIGDYDGGEWVAEKHRKWY